MDSRKRVRDDSDDGSATAAAAAAAPAAKGKAAASTTSSSAAKRSRVTPSSKQGVVGVPLACGINCFGQVGVGADIDERKRPALLRGELADGVQVRAVTAGGMHSAAVGADGKVYTWGCNDEKALGRDCSGDDEMSSEDKEFLPAKVTGVAGVEFVDVTAGDSHTAALAADGRVFACGCFRDPEGVFGFSKDVVMQETMVQIFPPKGVNATAVQIASGADHIAILAETDKGRRVVYTLGSGLQGQLGRVSQRHSARNGIREHPRTTTPADVAKRRTTVAALETLLTPMPVESRELKRAKIVSVSCGSWSTYALTDTGKVFAWGLNNYSQLGTPRRSADDTCVFYPAKGKSWDKQPIVAIAAGQHHALGLDDSGRVLTLGRGDTGRLGHGDTAELSEPRVVAGLADVKVEKVAAGLACSFAIASSGTAYAWGFGESLQLASGDESDALAPIPMGGKQLETRSVLAVDGGGQHTIILAKDK